MGWEDKQIEANGEWRIKQSELNGYVKAQFDSIHESLKRVESKIDFTGSMCFKNQNDISSLKAQAAVVGVMGGAIVSGIVSIFAALFMKVF